MQSRLDFYKASPDAAKAMIAMQAAVNKLSLKSSLLELVKLRASQLNGCAYCVDVYSTDARRQGERDRRLHAVAVWRESPFFTEEERAALAWTEALTRISDTGAPDSDYERLSRHFDERQRADLTVAINTVNAWNRLEMAFRSVSVM
ncbi:carboxymuconolactone decarboxylase family protein [Lysobacter sp. MMG2]|uniref:carboxymuconolactone decarboxylase family protein n=1 Tax=Lysobacter sp. MMG2 TaxID=2801338 RepID=UPI001C2502CD|nr:carboxymuconolactone decarboxylase family protein [Lysobacter sp. MMG2]MBU8974793.1 carboxymuconolactone decarboxylase family protein [Lysobacter sp. MMG2]